MKGRNRSTFLVFVVMLAAALFSACSDGMTDPELEASTSARSSTGSTGGNGDATTQSTCSADPNEGCYIIGTCNQADAFQSCYEQGGGSYGGGSGGGSTGGSGGGGSGGTGSTSYDNPAGVPIANDELVDCHLGDSGNCDIRRAEPDEINRAKEEITKIRDEGICGEAKSRALQIVNNGLRVWTNEVKDEGQLLLGDIGWEYVNSAGTERVPVMHLWTDPRGFNAWTIAHEAFHGLGYLHGNTLVGPDGVTRSMDGMAKYCSQH